MQTDQKTIDRFEQLRQQAEDFIKKQPDDVPESFGNIIDLVHELNIHQTELKIQNEELQRAQNELLELKQEYESLYEFAPCAYITINPNVIITRANLFAVKILEKDRKYLIHSTFNRFIAPGWEDTFLTARQIAGQTGNKQSVELPLKRKNDTPAWVRVEIEADCDENQAVIQWRLVLIDITERKRMDEELIMLSTAIKQSPVSIVITGLDGNIQYVNPKFCRLTGYSENEVLGKNPRILQSGRTSEQVYKNLWKTILSGNKWRGEFQNKKKNGALYCEEAVISPIKNKEGHITHFLGVKEDITERKKMAHQLQQIQKIEAIGTLAGGIAHDFNNMLGIIAGNVSYVLNILKNEDDITESLLDVQESVKQGANLTRQLITFAKGGAPIKKVIELNALIKDTAKLVLRGSNAICKFNLDENLWRIEADEGQLNKALTNLIINSDQAMPEGGTIQIDTENKHIDDVNSFLFPLGPYVSIKITDQGIGIPEKHLSKIFDPFFSTKQKGSGLGLSTTFSIIKKHNGHIWAESTIGTGTTFTIYLPVTDKTLSQPERPDKIDHKGQGKILVMDDQEDILKMAQRILSGMGYETVFAKDGAQAIEIYRKAYQSSNKFDLVVLDLTIPGGMGGVKTIPELLKINPNANVVVSSGYSNDPVISDYQAYGFCSVLEKPYSIDQVAALLNKILGEKTEPK